MCAYRKHFTFAALEMKKTWRYQVCHQYAYWHHFCHSSNSHYCFSVSVNL